MNRSTSSRALLLAAACGLALTATVRAHDEGSAVLRVQVAGEHAEVTYAMPLRSLAAVVPGLDPNRDGFLSAREADRAATTLAGVLLPQLRLTTGQGALAASVVGAAPQGGPLALGDADALVGVVLRYPAPLETLQIRYRLPKESQLPRRLLVEMPQGATGVLGDGQDQVTWRPARATEIVADLTLEGARHIFAGWDHLAFLLALLIVAGKPRKVLLLVSAFTVAHSVTLGLTALGVVTPSGPLVEAVIALSIVYVAIENLVLRGDCKHRAALTFAFGLVHGMGFGGALAELDLSNPVPALLGFNLGVEAGQLLVVAAVLPILLLIKRRPLLYERLVVTGGSIAIGAAGLYWLVERLSAA